MRAKSTRKKSKSFDRVSGWSSIEVRLAISSKLILASPIASKTGNAARPVNKQADKLQKRINPNLKFADRVVDMDEGHDVLYSSPSCMIMTWHDECLEISQN
jgi:hypothetical protein